MDGRSKEHRTNDLGFILLVMPLYIVVPPLPLEGEGRGGERGSEADC